MRYLRPLTSSQTSGEMVFNSVWCQNRSCSTLPLETLKKWETQGTWLSIPERCIVSFKLEQLSVQFSRSVTSDSLRPHESQHARPPCPSPTPRVHSNSCPSSRWCHPAISSSVVPFSSCPQSLPASDLFQWVNSSHEVAKVLEFQL